MSLKTLVIGGCVFLLASTGLTFAGDAGVKTIPGPEKSNFSAGTIKCVSAGHACSLVVKYDNKNMTISGMNGDESLAITIWLANGKTFQIEWKSRDVVAEGWKATFVSVTGPM